MSGIIEFYKIDKSRIEGNLLSLISDIYIFKNFKEFVFSYNLDKKYFKVSYENIIEKIKFNFFKINHCEFEVILKWIFECYDEQLDRDTDFLDNLGLLKIGDLHSREETSIFFCFGEYGINDFDDRLTNINTSWNDLNSPSKSDEFKLVIDFLTIVLLNQILKDEKLENNYKNELKEMLGDLSQNEKMCLSSTRFLKSILNKNDFANLYNDDLVYMLECSESYLWKIRSLKENIADYNGLIYRLDVF